jgi:hypothetical protein
VGSTQPPMASDSFLFGWCVLLAASSNRVGPADRSASRLKTAECSRRGIGGVDHRGVIRLLEIRKECSEEVVERTAVGRSERAQEALLVRDVRLDGFVDDGPSTAGQPDEDAPAVCRVGSSLDEARLDQAVEALGHSTRGEKGRSHQLTGVELVRRPSATQCREEVEPAGLQPVLREFLPELRVCQLNGTEEAAEKPERRHVQVGTFSPPLSEDLIDVVRRLVRHRRENTSRK